jgi:hypothetical protein
MNGANLVFDMCSAAWKDENWKKIFITNDCISIGIILVIFSKSVMLILSLAPY